MTDDQKRTHHVSVVLNSEELGELDEWSWGERIRSRSEAIRRLIRAGLDAKKVK